MNSLNIGQMKFQNPILKTFVLGILLGEVAVQSGARQETNGIIKIEIIKGEIFTKNVVTKARVERQQKDCAEMQRC